MLTYVVAFLVAMVVAACVTPLVAQIAHRYGLLDQPGDARKVHDRAIPRVGGLAIAIAFFAPIVGLAVYTNRISWLLYADVKLVGALFTGAALVLALGIWDDVKGASVRLKLMVQIAVAVGMWIAGFRIELLGQPLGSPIVLGLFSLPITTLWIVGVINALNLIDGLDGLAAGIALFAVVVMFGVAFSDNDVLLCVFSVALAGTLIGFLFFNFNPARIFLGDSGSMFLGFILATISIWTQRKGTTVAALMVPIFALGVPLLDTALSVVRRISRRQSPFRADREHLHHRLLALGLSHRSAVLTLYTLSAIFALGALAMLDNNSVRRTIALATIVLVVMLVVRRIGITRLPIRQNSRAVLDSSSLRDEVRVLARAIRLSDRLDCVWPSFVDLAQRIGCRSLQISLLNSAKDAPEHLSGDFDWSESLEWTETRVQHRFPLAEAGESFGELVISRLPETDREDELRARMYLEFLREALIDFFWTQPEDSSPSTRNISIGDRTIRRVSGP